MTTTTGGAARVLAWLEEWLQTEWPELEVYCTSVTEQWAAIAVVGPKAREVLQAAGTDIDLAATRFPHLAFKEGTVAGIPARVFRISFSGELAYEINVPWGYGAALWDALWAAGEPFGITPYGTESHARAARREGLHHRRPGHRRHGDAARSRHGLDRRQGEEGLHRQARPRAAGRARRRSASSSSAC